MKHHVTCDWKDNFTFEANVNDHKIIMDLSEAAGGKDKGPRPKPLLLAALAGCSGVDVVSILNKMRLNVKSFSMSVEGELTEEEPKYYKNILIIYHFKGVDLNHDKLERAIKLSLDQYCAVSAMLKKAAHISYEIKIEH